MKQKLGELLGDAIVYMRESFRFKPFYVRKNGFTKGFPSVL